MTAMDSHLSTLPVQARFWRPVESLFGPLLLALTYYLGAQAAFYIGTLSDKIFALFWPPNVILFCALMSVPKRRWWFYIAAAFPAHVIAEHGVGMPAPQILLAFVTNCTIAVLNAYAVRKYVGDSPWFGSLRKASIYITITAGIGPGITALGGAFVPILGGGSVESYWIFYAHWFLANALPNLTLGPVFLIWFSDGLNWSRWIPSRRQAKPIALALILTCTCIVVVHVVGLAGTSRLLPALLLLPMPVVLWAAVRYGEKGASGAILVVTVIMTWWALRGTGFLASDDPERSVLALQIFLFGVAVPILLLGALIDELRRAERTTRRLATSLMRAQDDERRRIARDLHDSTGQNLIAATLISNQIQRFLPTEAAPILRQLDQMLQQSISEIRTVSYLLHPPLLDEAGLGLALREYVNGYVERSGVSVDLHVASDVDRLPNTSELVLFRVVQEALTNVARHSGSAIAKIDLMRKELAEGECVVLSVEDAGKGIRGLVGKRAFGRRSGSGLTLGVGLASMQERMQQVGGWIQIETAVGRTVVRAVLPVQQEDSEDRSRFLEA